MKIETEDYVWECGDGCCTQYGTYLYIDGKLLEDREFSSSGDAYLYVLEKLFNCEVGFKDDEYSRTGQVCSLSAQAKR